MADTFTAYSPGAPTTVNGFEVPGYTSQGTTPGKVQGPSAQSSDTATRTVTVGGVELPVVEGGLHIPIEKFIDPTTDELLIKAGEYGVGWEFVCTATSGVDRSLLNSRWLVVNAPAKSYATARRLDVVRLI